MASRQEQIVTASNAATVSRWGKIAAMDIKKSIPEDVGDGTCWTQPGRRARNEYLLGRLPPWEEENVPCSVFGRKPERSSNLRSSALKSWLYLRPRSSEPVVEYKESQGPYHQSTSVKRALRELRYSTRTRSDSETRTRIKLDRDGKIDKDFLKAEQEDWANNPFNPANFSQPS